MRDALPHLPHAVLTRVFQHLDSKQVLQCSSVSKSWLEASRADAIWSAKCLIEFGGRLPSRASSSNTDAYSTMRSTFQEPSTSLDWALKTHCQLMARFKSLRQQVQFWTVTVSNGPFHMEIDVTRVTAVAQGVWLFFSTLESAWPPNVATFAVDVFACHSGGRTQVASAPDLCIEHDDRMQRLEQAHRTGMSTWLESVGHPESPTLMLAVYVHFDQLLTALRLLPLPQVLPVIHPAAKTAVEGPWRRYFTVVLDFSSIQGEALGAVACAFPHVALLTASTVVFTTPFSQLRLLGNTSNLCDWEKEPELDSEGKVKRLMAWLAGNAAADICLYDERGMLRVGRTCVEIWQEDGSEADGEQFDHFMCYFLLDLEATADVSVFCNAVGITLGREPCLELHLQSGGNFWQE